MGIPNEKDIAFTDDGDINFTQVDFMLQYSEVDEVSKYDVLKQIVINRVKSIKPDWFYDNVGANLESILGKENSKETAQLGAQLIIESLAGDGYIDENNIYVKPIPTDLFTIVYYLAIRVSDNDALQFKINIALNAGVNIEEM